MSGCTRRSFLRQSAVFSGAMGLLSGSAGHSQEPVALAPETSSPEAGAPTVTSIARWQGETVGEAGLRAVASKLTEAAVSGLGGMGRFVANGDVVWIKPNMAWNRTAAQGANTNPDVVATLVRLCLEAGAKKVKVGDRTVHAAAQVYAKSGIETAAREAGAEVVYIDENRFREVALRGERLQKWPLYPEIIECDLVINVPVVKHHGLSGVTLCMKNYMGIIGGNRGRWHQDLASCLCDITAYMKPRLSVLDAVRVMTNHGPTGGSPRDVKRMDTVAAGTDIVALDGFGGGLLGRRPEQVAAVKAAYNRGLGEIDYRKLPYREIAVS